jgi:hypothetical protein
LTVSSSTGEPIKSCAIELIKFEDDTLASAIGCSPVLA